MFESDVKVKCAICGKIIPIKTIRDAFVRSMGSTRSKKVIVCDACYHEKCESCSSCGRRYLAGFLIRFAMSPGSICMECMSTGGIYMTCKSCHRAFQAERDENGDIVSRHCPSCRSREVTCTRCGTRFIRRLFSSDTLCRPCTEATGQHQSTEKHVRFRRGADVDKMINDPGSEA